MEQEKFTKFWRAKSPFSNWHFATFVMDGITFNCSEQAMMYGKAKLFNDQESMKKILAEPDPREQKKLGRNVKGFNKEIWEANCKQIVYDACKAKFTQDPKLLSELLKGYGTTYVEASPSDDIWGIKLAAEDPRSDDRATWQGKNWLGEVLTNLCNDLYTTMEQQIK